MIKPLTCPVCQQTLGSEGADSPLFPFCSERCKSVDLFRWTEGKYAIVEDIADRPDVLAELIEEAERQADESQDYDDQDEQ